MSLACSVCPVRDRAACSALSDAQRDDLARRGRHRTLAAGETLFAAGEESSACATLISGALKISATAADGAETIVGLVHPAGFVGELFSPFAAHEVSAVAPSEVCLFGPTDLADAAARYPKLSEALLRRAQADLHAARDLLDLSRRRGAEARVAGLVLALAQAASASPCHPAQAFDLPLGRADIAAMLGLTIETVSRQFTALERAGVIRRDGRRGIELLDPARLEAMAA